MLRFISIRVSLGKDELHRSPWLRPACRDFCYVHQIMKSPWTMSDMVKYRAVSLKKDQIASLYFSVDALKEKQIVMEQNCTQFKDRFYKDEFVFGEERRTKQLFIFTFMTLIHRGCSKS